MSKQSTPVDTAVNFASQVANHPALIKLRNEQTDRGFFDTILKYAAPVALSIGKELLGGGANRGLNDDAAPLALNLGAQLSTFPELAVDPAKFKQVFDSLTPIVADAAEALKNEPATRSLLGSADDLEHSNAIAEAVLPTVLNTGKDSSRGFFDFISKYAPVAFNVAKGAISAFQQSQGQSRGLGDTTPEKIKNGFPKHGDKLHGIFTSKANKKGVKFVTTLVNGPQGRRALSGNSPDASRGIFGSIIQHLAPIAINVAQGFFGGGTRDLSDVSSDRGLFGFMLNALPTIGKVAMAAANALIPASRDLNDKEREARVAAKQHELTQHICTKFKQQHQQKPFKTPEDASRGLFDIISTVAGIFL